ncbi:PepSY domain-containing protein [Ornithinibacillus salinisoli]|uniref:PepSY domain-containing protein n=1 Tax=Ornithinibacillus salinisoli TaxID=1848459 RepID=A0ABW4W575_9BACI
MGMKRAVLAAGLGVAVGYLAKQQLDRYQKVTPEKALQQAKETFKKQGPISGSWIYMKPEDIEKNGLTYNAYRGGITRSIDGENKQYEFFVDVETGAVIDAFETY